MIPISSIASGLAPEAAIKPNRNSGYYIRVRHSWIVDSATLVVRE
jgi:hypothetical protein